MKLKRKRGKNNFSFLKNVLNKKLILIMFISIFLIVLVFLFFINAEKITGKAIGTCSDTDKGFRPDIKGSVTYLGKTYPDVCVFSNTKVVERYCSGGMVREVVSNCANGCKNGACVRKCTDSDNGINASVKGYVTDSVNTYYDSCYSKTKLQERICKDNNLLSTYVNCGSGKVCKEGKCIIPYFEIRKSGDPKDKLDLLFIGEGYTDDSEFKKSAEYYANTILNDEFFSKYKDRINIYAVNSPINMGCASKGCPFCDSDKLKSITSFFPYDQIIVLVNKEYISVEGCSDFNRGTFIYAKNKNSPMVLLHEFGHSFGNLLDEYSSSFILGLGLESDSDDRPQSNQNCKGNCNDWCSDVSNAETFSTYDCSKNKNYEECANDGFCWWQSRVTGNPDPAKCLNVISVCETAKSSKEQCERTLLCYWSDKPDSYYPSNCRTIFVEFNLGNICQNGEGCYRGCTYSNWYRGTRDSKMRHFKENSWGAVNTKILEEKMKNYK